MRNRFSLNEVEKVGRRTVRVIVSSACSADASLFNEALIFIAILLNLAEARNVFQEVDFTTGVELGEG
jgi:hypothetical protein